MTSNYLVALTSEIIIKTLIEIFINFLQFFQTRDLLMLYHIFIPVCNKV